MNIQNKLKVIRDKLSKGKYYAICKDCDFIEEVLSPLCKSLSIPFYQISNKDDIDTNISPLTRNMLSSKFSPCLCILSRENMYDRLEKMGIFLKKIIFPATFIKLSKSKIIKNHKSSEFDFFQTFNPRSLNDFLSNLNRAPSYILNSYFADSLIKIRGDLLNHSIEKVADWDFHRGITKKYSQYENEKYLSILLYNILKQDKQKTFWRKKN